MSSSFWLLAVGSCDLSQAEKETTACKADQIHKMTTIFTQKDNLRPFCEFAELCKQFFVSQIKKNHVTRLAAARK